MEIVSIKMEKFEYDLTEYVDRGYIKADYLNEVLDHARLFLDQIGRIHQHPKLSWKLFVYDYDQINAFTKKHEDHYIIAISVGSLLKLCNWFDLWTRKKEVLEKLGADEHQISGLSKSLFEMAVNFLVAHEYYHVLNGHCDLPKSEECFLKESPTLIRDKDHAVFLQCLEYDADCCAAAGCTNLLMHLTESASSLECAILEKFGDVDNCGGGNSNESKSLFSYVFQKTLTIDFKRLFFSIFSVFKLFSEADQADFIGFMNDNLYAYDHPYAGIRVHYVGVVIYIALRNCIGEEMANACWLEGYEWLISFEKDILNTEDVRDLFFSIAMTEKGQRLTTEISNAWEFVKPKLEKYAHGELAPFEKIHPASPLIDEEGHPIRRQNV